MIFVALLILFVVLILYFFFTKKSSTKILQENGQPAIPIPGTTELLLNAIDVNGLLEGMDFMVKKNFEHGIGSFLIGPMKFISVWEPELIEAVKNCPSAQKKGKFYRILFSSVSNGVFTHPGGQEWKELRKPLVQSMVKKYLENDFFSHFVFKSQVLIDFLKRNRQGKCFDIGPDLCASVFDIFLVTNMGVQSNELWDRKWAISDITEEEFEISLGEMMRLHHYSIHFLLNLKHILMKIINFTAKFNFFMKWKQDRKSSEARSNNIFESLFDGEYWSNSAFFEEICSFLRLTLMSYIDFHVNRFYLGLTKEARKLRNSENKVRECLGWVLDERKRCGMDDIDGIEYYSDFLMRRKEQHNLSHRRIIYEMADIIAAGSDTTPVVASSVLLYIAMHPEVQEKLYREQQEIYGDSDRDTVVEDLPKMKYLEMVIKETLRFISPPAIAKLTDEACAVGKYRIPKSCLLVVYARKIHRHPKYYERPEEFYPEHFLPEAEAKRPRYAYVPFGVGPRKCPGFLYAFILLKVMISMVIRNFTLKTPLTMETIKYNYRLLLNVRGGYPIELSLRNNEKTM